GMKGSLKILRQKTSLRWFAHRKHPPTEKSHSGKHRLHHRLWLHRGRAQNVTRSPEPSAMNNETCFMFLF
ncbi:MAG: hypothetical protein LBV54_04230, partial [Puniceicoccales bacterium]|nr:hypothetical protein [Puniceicoccales bacterium]